MRRDAEQFRRSLLTVDEYRLPEVYQVQPEDYSSDARYIDTEYVHYMGNSPKCHMLTLHYDTNEAADRRNKALSWTVWSNHFPIYVVTRGRRIYLIRRPTDE